MWPRFSSSLLSRRGKFCLFIYVFIYSLNICFIRLASLYKGKKDNQNPEFKKYIFIGEAWKSKQINILLMKNISQRSRLWHTAWGVYFYSLYLSVCLNPEKRSFERINGKYGNWNNLSLIFWTAWLGRDQSDREIQKVDIWGQRKYSKDRRVSDTFEYE